MDLQNLAFDIKSLLTAYANGIRPEDVLREVYRRIDAVADPGIFIHLCSIEETLNRVSALGPYDPESKPLWGVPFAVKDNIDAAGIPTTAACPAYAYVPAKDAFIVDRLHRAGAILIGKTNLDQFATGLVGLRSPYQAPKNALDPTIVPGGSSSGSAVAVAHGLVGFALGTDTAGSGRVPAALNNIVGLKPTLGTLSAGGVVPACRTLDTASIFALTVEDAHHVYRVAAAYDANDCYARDFGPPLLPAAIPDVFTVGIPNANSREFFGDTLQAASFETAIETLRALGAMVHELDFTPLYQVASMLYEGAWVAERYTVVEDLMQECPDQLYPVTREVIGAAEKFSAMDAFRGFYRLKALQREAQSVLRSIDLLCVPSIPTFYSVEDLEQDPMGPNSRLGTYTNFVNLMDLCGIAVPTASRDDGRPGSVTLLAEAGRDADISAIAAAIHRDSGVILGATGWRNPGSGFPANEAGEHEIAVAVVGAHMSGLPLNSQLSELNARFLYSSATSEDYRLYLLPGGPPYRPGLVRDVSGASIRLEVWSIPISRFGELMQKIPSPLGIGTIKLVDGDQVKGFLCESIATNESEDITDYGGWRAYITRGKTGF